MNKFDVPYEEYKQDLQDLETSAAAWMRQDPNLAKVTNRKLRELMALDDWSDMAKVALPYIIKYGAPVVSKLWKKHVQPLHKKWFGGGDEGLNPIDQPENPLQPYKEQRIGGLNRFAPGLTHLPFIGNSNSVSMHYLKAILCPEMYAHRQSTKYPTKVALATGIFEYSVAADAAGDFGVYVFPVNVVTGFNGAGSNPFICVLNAGTFDPVTGINGAAPTNVSGPLFSSAAINRYRPVSAAVQVIPTVSFNTPGNISIGYFQSEPNSTINQVTSNSSPALPRADMANLPFYVTGNNKTTYRMITIPSDRTTDQFYWNNNNATGQMFEAFYILGTGWTPNIGAIKISYTYVIDFVANGPSQPICPSAYPQTGPMTPELIAMVAASFPVIQTLTLSDAKRIAQLLPDQTVSFEEAHQILGNLLASITPSSSMVLSGETKSIIEPQSYEPSDLIIDFGPGNERMG
jgi:hypothetical protein